MAKISILKKIIAASQGPRQTLNERGDTTVLFSFCVVILSSLMILLALELHHELRLLKKRKELFLCTKELKGELHQFLKFMGRSNWGIENARKAALIAAFIPGLQGMAANVEKIRTYLKYSQTLALASYLKTLTSLKGQGCPLDPRMFITPFELGTDTGFNRTQLGAARLRKKSWSYYFVDLPYTLEIRTEAISLESVFPEMKYTTREKGAMLSSLSFWH